VASGQGRLRRWDRGAVASGQGRTATLAGEADGVAAAVLGQGRAAALGQARAPAFAGEAGRATIPGTGGGGCLGRGLLRPGRREGRRRQPVPPPPEP
jgi:hypothetical protein